MQPYMFVYIEYMECSEMSATKDYLRGKSEGYEERSE